MDAQHAAGRITRPLRHNGQHYSAINILMLWASAVEQGFAAPIWMQATELNAHVRKGEKGSLVVYANAVTKTEDDGNAIAGVCCRTLWSLPFKLSPTLRIRLNRRYAVAR
jgi:antirestriction protein ArdC